MISYLRYVFGYTVVGTLTLLGALVCVSAAHARDAFVRDALQAHADPGGEASLTRRYDQLRCLVVFRVIDVDEDDVLNLREEPRVPAAHERNNKLLGIPANATWVEYLGRSYGEWRLVRYLGVVGYANGRYLAHDFVLCVQGSGQPL
jgi:hypothetical protein